MREADGANSEPATALSAHARRLGAAIDAEGDLRQLAVLRILLGPIVLLASGGLLP